MIERKVVKALPSSFVASNMKLATDRGSGEAKLWVGQMSNAAELDAFFCFDSDYTYSFSRENLVEYLNQVKLEYIFQKFNNYKDASLSTWTDNYSQIKALPDSDFSIRLTKFTDESRYYVRAEEEIFRKIFRKIAVPKLTNVVFVKDSENKSIVLTLELNLEYESVTEDGEDISTDVLNHNLYGIHIKEQNDALSEDRPHICIGWSRLGDLSDVATKDELTSRYVLAWPDSKPRSQGQNIGQIWRFINDVQVGDYVIFADGNLLHIGRVESDYYYDETQYTTQNEDYKNTRRVAWLKKNINRAEISESLHRSLMTAMSIWTMNDYRAAIADLIMGTYIKDEANDENDIETVPPQEQKERFRIWMTNQRKANGEPYSTNTITSYISQMSRGYDSFDKYHGYESVFEIQSAEELNEYTEYLFNAPGFDEFNDAAGNKACSNGFVKYGQFLAEQNSVTLELRFNTPLASTKPRNRIIFGAPGTGKSFMLNRDRKALLGDDNETDYERVTFHPDYSYANFVGTYKPVPSVDSDGKDAITYEYVPGPFMRVYVNALKNGRTEDVRPFLLIIEEINRANVAAVFGDIFQLLDRDETGVSEYPIQASEDMKKYLAKELGGEPDDYGKIKLPNNLFIWATMNSADQGVFPMDTAFKRRWDFTYIGIDDNDADIRGKTVVLGTARRQRVEWNKLRKAINRFLAKQKINEDKQLGPYFISRSIVVPENGNEIDSAAFIDTFKNKVLMYLFEDAAKQKRSTLFEGCFDGKGRYSEICREFEEKGIGIFYHEIALDTEPEDLAAANGNITETGDEQV